MNRIMKLVKKICIIAGLLSAAFFTIYLLVSVQKCGDKPSQEVAKNEYLLPRETYRPPIVKIPFTKSTKQPVKNKDLPIPREDVKTTIVVKNPVPGAKDITIIVDKKGDIYKSKDTPKDAKIEVIEWKPKLFDIKPRLGYSLVYSGETYHCLSLDVLRMGKFYVGGEAGISLSRSYLFGVSGKYHFLTLEFFGGRKANVLATLGYNFLNKGVYGGITVRF